MLWKYSNKDVGVFDFAQECSLSNPGGPLFRDFVRIWIIWVLQIECRFVGNLNFPVVRFRIRQMNRHGNSRVSRGGWYDLSHAKMWKPYLISVIFFQNWKRMQIYYNQILKVKADVNIFHIIWIFRYGTKNLQHLNHAKMWKLYLILVII